MELTESLNSINQQLTDAFGVDTVTGREMWRVVWSENQLEKRYGDYEDFTREGIYLRTVSEVREVPKYRQWVKAKYVLERLTVIPDISTNELPTSKLSYEPMYVFENFKGEPLPPRFDVCKILIDSLYASMGKRSLAKYEDDYSKYTEEARNQRLNEIMEYLWDPSDYADAAVAGEGIAVPSNYIKES